MALSSTLRSLFRTPRLSAAVVLTLALGVAAFTTAFGIVDAALFRQPPFPDATRVTLLFLERNPAHEPPRRERWSFARYRLLAEQQQSFESVASYSPASLTLSGGGEGTAELIRGERVAPSYFQVLRVRPQQGRLLGDAENDPMQPSHVALIGEDLWTRRFAADPAIIGQTIRLNGVPLTVIGVLPRGFRGLSGRAEAWVPATVSPLITYAEYLTTNQNFISVVGRLREGVSLSTAAGELEVLGQSINRAIPSEPGEPDERVTASAIPINQARVDPTVRRSLLILLGAVGLLHLLACANVTNLLLGRVATGRHDAAVRLALGSSTGRLFGHILREGLVLSLTGGALGVGLAWWAGGLVTPPANLWAPRNFYGSLAPFDEPAFSLAQLGFGLVLALATALLVSGAPALSAVRIDVSSGIRSGSRGLTGESVTLRRPSLRGLIVGVEAALAMLLVVTAGLLIESFQRMRRVDVGVDPGNILTFWIIPSEARVPPATAPAFITRVLEALSRVPGVQSATVDGGAPLSGTASSTLYIEGQPPPPPGQAPGVLRHYVGPDHFRTLGIPLIRGRGFTPADEAGAPRVTVISETAAGRFWPDQDPIGQRVWFGGGSDFDSPERSAEIVGIVGDVAYRPLDRDPNFASFYTPYRQFTYASRMVFLRTAGDPMAVVADVREAIAEVDPELALQDVQPLTELMSGSWARHRFDAMLFGGFGIAALLLAASGIFAVLAYAVTTRTREFGIRIALGADNGRVLRQVLREGMVFPVIGLLLGVGGAFAVTRVLRASLYEISPMEPRVLLAMAALLLVVAVAACLGPAWRATRADPIEALRSE
ncbi:MAG TPA: ABC transporter permease [Gemmatimonadales bacterium]|nr:ABC transporter permease [Gemmatimonadales bacterium]